MVSIMVGCQGGLGFMSLLLYMFKNILSIFVILAFFGEYKIIHVHGWGVIINLMFEP